MRRSRWLWLAGLLVLFGCEGGGGTWIYWLADPAPATIGDADGDYVVTDYSADGADAGAFTVDDVAAMSQDGERAVLAYFSIGEAEVYRYYWDDAWDADGDGEPDKGAPSWLGPENAEWEGNYKVRYWDAGWQELLIGPGGYLERILEAEFDGVYLDIIDAYFYWAEDAPAGDLRPMEDTAADMLALIEAIADAGKVADPDFQVFPQNGEFVGYDAGEQMDRLLDAIDGFGVEDVFCPGDADEDNPFEPDESRLEVLDELIYADKIVLSVDYLTDEDLIDQYLDAASSHDFHTCVAHRDLASLPE
jgi:cysteinyl-tRNA synthetase